MYFLINELSFIGQANNIYEADELMIQFLNIIKEVELIQVEYPLLKHSSLSNSKLTPQITLKEWLFQKLKSSDTSEKQELIF